jgi:ubiquinone/menaquinone biosynthesis C-methylase UbiE
MRLPKRVLRELDADRVRRINEIYHNLENAGYDRQHEDIPQFEGRFWEDAAGRYRAADRPLVWLDYGTGTGFVPAAIAKHLRPEDTVICCDVSDEMLRLCAAKLPAGSFPCPRRLEKIDGKAIPAPSNAVDILSVNSVLHHLFDLTSFAGECERVLKPGGLLIVAHEPNADTRLPLTGRLVRSVATALLRPQTMVFRAAEWSPLVERILRCVTSRISPKYRWRNKLLADAARQIRQEGLLGFDLRGTELQQIVDFQSQQGFARAYLLQEVFARFELLEFRTYGHLGFLPRGRAGEAVDRYLRRCRPEAGREICFVLRRSAQTATAGRT